MKRIWSLQFFSARKSFLSALGIVALVALHRRPDAIWLPQFWAEDGVIFFAEARRVGAAAIFSRYNGYYNLYPRLIAWLGDLLVPPRFLPSFYYLGLLSALVLVVCVIHWRRLSLPYPFLMSVALVLAPVGNEVFLGLTNSQWILALLLPLLVTAPAPHRWKERVLELILLILVGLTGPFITFLAPLFVARALNRRTGYEFLMIAIVILLAWLQLPDLGAGRLEGSGLGELKDFQHAFIFFFSSLFVGPSRAATQYTEVQLSLMMALLSIALCALIWYSHNRREYRSIAFLFSALAIIAATLYAFRAGPGVLVDSGERYRYFSLVCLLWTLIVILPWAKRVSVPILALIGLHLCLDFDTYRSEPLRDYHWPKRVRCLERKLRCRIPINPSGWVIETEGIE